MNTNDNDETLAWIDRFQEIELDAKIRTLLQQSAAERVPQHLRGDANIKAHARTTLMQTLLISTRDEVHAIRSVQDAKYLILRNHSILAEAAVSEQTRQGEVKLRDRRKAKQCMTRCRQNRTAEEWAEDLFRNQQQQAHHQRNRTPEERAEDLFQHRQQEAGRRRNRTPEKRAEDLFQHQQQQAGR